MSDSVNFELLGLDPVLCKAVKGAFDIEVPTDIQESTIKCILGEGESDVLVRSRTGSGKTLAFLLPILNGLLAYRRSLGPDINTRTLGTQVLILVPTRELAAQTATALTKLLAKINGRDHWLVSSSLSGGDNRQSEKERLRKGCHIVVATPGRLLDHLQNTERWAKDVSSSCKWLVMDEADRLLDMGFEKIVTEIIDRVMVSRRPRIILCSATVGDGRQQVFGHTLNNPVVITQKAKKAKKDVVSATTDVSGANVGEEGPSNLTHFYFCTPTKYRLPAMLGYLQDAFTLDKEKNQKNNKIVLFTICCSTVDFIYSLLTTEKVNALPEGVKVFKLHGNMEHKDRLNTFEAFTNYQKDGKALLVCTDVAARGLNLSNVTAILQYDAPCDLNDYIHRAGRTARQEDSGVSILFLMPSERDYIQAVCDKGIVVKMLKWESYVERIANTVKNASVPVDIEDDDEEPVSMAIETKKKILAWFVTLQEMIKKQPALHLQAKDAFLSFVRAYATHPANEKAIFHIRKLHLGHLATTFLLAEPPKSIAANRVKLEGKDGGKGKDGKGRDLKGKDRFKNGGQNSKMATNGGNKRKRPVSEFDAGDYSNSKSTKGSNGKKKLAVNRRRK